MNETLERKTRRRVGAVKGSRGTTATGSGESKPVIRHTPGGQWLRDGEIITEADARQIWDDGTADWSWGAYGVMSQMVMTSPEPRQVNFVLVEDQRRIRASMVWMSRYLALCDARWDLQPGDPLRAAIERRMQRAEGRRLV